MRLLQGMVGGSEGAACVLDLTTENVSLIEVITVDWALSEIVTSCRVTPLFDR